MSAINLEPVLEAKANEDLPIAVGPSQVEPPAELEVHISVAQLEKEIALLHEADRIYEEEPADQLSHGNLPVVAEANIIFLIRNARSLPGGPSKRRICTEST